MRRLVHRALTVLLYAFGVCNLVLAFLALKATLPLWAALAAYAVLLVLDEPAVFLAVALFGLLAVWRWSLLAGLLLGFAGPLCLLALYLAFPEERGWNRRPARTGTNPPSATR